MRLRPVLGRAGEAWRDIRAADLILTVTSGGPGGTVIPLLISIRDSFSHRRSRGRYVVLKGSRAPVEPLSRRARSNTFDRRFFFMIGAWRSLVARLLREQEAVGSNPIAPTIKKKGEAFGSLPAAAGT